MVDQDVVCFVGTWNCSFRLIFRDLMAQYYLAALFRTSANAMHSSFLKRHPSLKAS